ncbi:2-octaprenyl-6-methoxyphenyl hydroxylase [Teredinibacter turnerae]|uniref:2-octaprenyl-6-methoxyphenyl hydroxylase n=1 Tax=Teredinibacter turnerae TaxID=2426 RepID=UPI000361E8CA|nr:2-octaprenyl-6-methoxyphenyl hydroxylase [Teredinibacter turnerae]
MKEVAATRKLQDIVVVGGGMVGLTQALLLAHQIPDAEITLVESLPVNMQDVRQPSFDARATALSPATVDVLQKLALWPFLESSAQPITRVHVSDRGHVGQTEYRQDENSGRALGYVIENRRFGAELTAACLRTSNISILAPAEVLRVTPVRAGVELVVRQASEHTVLAAQLVIIADGANSPLREKLGIGIDQHDYRQAAVIANLSFSEPHHGAAFERFTEEGPLAILPMVSADGRSQSHRAALVWTRPAAQLEETLGLDDAAFIDQLQVRFGYRLGRCSRVGERSSYPLKMVFAREQVRRGIVFMGNAAHFLHPVAGQGFNLALRDCAQLAALLVQAWSRRQPLGDLTLLQEYLSQQAVDQKITAQLSHNFIQVFASHHPLLQLARNAGLLGISLLPGLKQEFFKQMMGQALPRAEFQPIEKQEMVG